MILEKPDDSFTLRTFPLDCRCPPSVFLGDPADIRTLCLVGQSELAPSSIGEVVWYSLVSLIHVDLMSRCLNVKTLHVSFSRMGRCYCLQFWLTDKQQQEMTMDNGNWFWVTFRCGRLSIKRRKFRLGNNLIFGYEL